MRPKPFERVCFGCKTKQNKKSLIRICKTDSKIFVDKNQVLGGKGVYFCTECAKKIDKTKALARAFRLNVSKETYEAVINDLKEF